MAGIGVKARMPDLRDCYWLGLHRESKGARAAQAAIRGGMKRSRDQRDQIGSFGDRHSRRETRDNRLYRPSETERGQRLIYRPVRDAAT